MAGVDLDAVQALLDWWPPDTFAGRPEDESGQLVKLCKYVPALITELRAARQFRADIYSALQPGRWRSYAGPDGVSTHEVIVDVAAALKRYEEHAARAAGA